MVEGILLSRALKVTYVDPVCKNIGELPITKNYRPASLVNSFRNFQITLSPGKMLPFSNFQYGLLVQSQIFRQLYLIELLGF